MNMAALIEQMIVDSIITNIEQEIKNSCHSRYVCKEGTEIVTDVGYVAEWFDEYKSILRKRYCEE